MIGFYTSFMDEKMCFPCLLCLFSPLYLFSDTDFMQITSGVPIVAVINVLTGWSAIKPCKSIKDEMMKESAQKATLSMLL